MSRNQLGHLVRSRIVERCHPGVYRLVASESSWHQSAMAATLSMPESALSHRSAARLWGLSVVSQRIELTVPPTCSTRREDFHIHRSNQMDGHVTEKDAIAVTTVTRTLIDLSRCISRVALGRVLDQACSLRLTTLNDVDQCLNEMVTIGRWRISELREHLATRTTVDERAESALERRVLKALRDGGLDEPEAQHWVTTRESRYRLDFAYPRRRIAIEVDGPHHLLPSVAVDDRKRDAELSLTGWTVLRVTIDSDLVAFVGLVRLATARAV